MWNLFEAMVAVFLVYVLMYVPDFFDVVIERLRPREAANANASDAAPNDDGEDNEAT